VRPLYRFDGLPVDHGRIVRSVEALARVGEPSGRDVEGVPEVVRDNARELVEAFVLVLELRRLALEGLGPAFELLLATLLSRDVVDQHDVSDDVSLAVVERTDRQVVTAVTARHRDPHLLAQLSQQTLVLDDVVEVALLVYQVGVDDI